MVKVRANLNLSMNQGNGLSPAEYIRGEVYDIPEELYEDNEDHFTKLDQEQPKSKKEEKEPKADEKKEEPDTEASDTAERVKDLVEDNKRAALDEMAKAVGFNPRDYSNKTEIAEAIVNKATQE